VNVFPAQPDESHLAWYALRAADSGGRAYPEAEHPYRSCYQRDRDRVVHCSAFRRLDYKTQVFVPHEQDHYRTRLTHTLEVAQIARTLSRALGANEDVAEAVALAHDLGHPPFGHTGEAILDELMADHGHFEHNRQSLHVVDYLEHPYPDFRGLNLTTAVRRCLAKHTTRYDTPLPGEFDDGLLAALEGQLVDLGDEIAYTSADLADALTVGWITTDQLAPLGLWQKARALAEETIPHARDIHKRIQACRNVLALMADGALAETARRLGALATAAATVKPVSMCTLAAPAPTALSPRLVQQAGETLAGFDAQLRALADQLQQFLMDNVYLHPQARERSTQCRAIIADLFNAYLADPALLPERYRRRIPADGPHRIICDYIAGMTDRFCRQEHERLAPKE
jgi:dGTPase